MSFLLALFSLAISTGAASSHEVRPAIGDVTIKEGEVTIELSLNLEAMIAEIDLNGLENTEGAPQEADYDRLRALPPAALETQFRAYWPQMRKDLRIETAAGRAEAELIKVEIPVRGDLALPRDSRIVLRASASGDVRIGWAKRYGALILRQQGVAEPNAAFTGMLNGGEMSPALNEQGGMSEGAGETFLRYVGVGFDHIIPKGLDHILFVLGLFFLAPRLWPLLWQVSAFTLAHTITLALGSANIIVVSPSIVEPLIAASIVYVAVENIFFRDLQWWRPALIFGFGLLHGLGFASVLDEFGLPDAQFIPALVGFNVGVEVGQLAVIAIAFVLVGYWFRNKPWYRTAIAIPASIAIAAVGAFWVVERTLL